MIEKNADAIQSQLDSWIDVEPADDTESLGGVNIGSGCPPELWTIAQWALARMRRQLIASGYLVLRSADNRGIWIYDESQRGEQRQKAEARARRQIKRVRAATIARVAYEYASGGKSCRLGWDN